MKAATEMEDGQLTKAIFSKYQLILSVPSEGCETECDMRLQHFHLGTTSEWIT